MSYSHYNPECPSCGGPQPKRQVGITLGGQPLFSCKDPWHKEKEKFVNAWGYPVDERGR